LADRHTRYAAPERLHDDCVCALSLGRPAQRSGDTG